MAGRMSLLDAVNEVLEGSGFSPVSSLSTDGPANARIAENGINRERLRVLAEGWWFNYQLELKLDPDANDEVSVPDQVLSFEVPGEDLVERNGKVFSKQAQSTTFEQGVSVNAILDFPFEEIPFHAQDYIVKTALRKFQMSRVGDVQVRNEHLGDEQNSRIALMQQEGTNSDANMLDKPDNAYTRRPPARGLHSQF